MNQSFKYRFIILSDKAVRFVIDEQPASWISGSDDSHVDIIDKQMAEEYDIFEVKTARYTELRLRYRDIERIFLKGRASPKHDQSLILSEDMCVDFHNKVKKLVRTFDFLRDNCDVITTQVLLMGASTED